MLSVNRCRQQDTCTGRPHREPTTIDRGQPYTMTRHELPRAPSILHGSSLQVPYVSLISLAGVNYVPYDTPD